MALSPSASRASSSLLAEGSSRPEPAGQNDTSIPVDVARPPSQPVSISTTKPLESQSSQVSSSFTTRKTPARSFVTHSVLSANDNPQYSSQNVRDETEELASWTFSYSEAHSLSNAPIPRHPSQSSTDSISHAESSRAVSHGENKSQAARRLSAEIARPDVIEEVSEPSTPVEARSTDFSRLPKQASILSNMFKRRKFGSESMERAQQWEEGQREEEEEEEEEEGEGNVGDRILVTEEDDDEARYREIHSYSSKPLSNLGDAADERTPLLVDSLDGKVSASRKGGDDLEHQSIRPRKKQAQIQRLYGEARKRTSKVLVIATTPKSWSVRAIWQKGILMPVSFLPCVFLGLLLNVLDGLSYGMILFPLSEPIFAQTGPDGLSMFYLSCIVSQLVFSFGGSVFKGAVGSEMIEVVPFFHKMTTTILAKTGRSQPHVVLATVVTAYALSSIITGIIFFLLGSLKLGSLVSFFPRHILIGCVGGVGFFLFKTGIEISARLEGSFSYNLDTLQQLFSKATAPLWSIPLGLAILLLVSKRFVASPYLVPGFFIGVVVIFYIVVTATSSLTVPDLRAHGWIFPKVEADVPFYHFYSLYDFKAVDWNALASAVPAMFALTFFGILHVPINIPALAIAAQEDDLNLNRELVAHGISNTLSGCLGSIQNYLVYVNSEMFISNGGNHRLAGFMLALATFAVWAAGPSMIGYVPIMVVGALIFYLAIALLEEAVYDTWGRMHRLEYLTVIVIVLVMGVYDFVAGVLVGIVLACLNFVVQTSQKSAIRATYSGEIVESTVRRHPIQRHFLREVGYQIYVTKLAGFLFFGSIVRVEKSSRALIEEEAFRRQPIRYLIFDLQHVNGIDYSAVEAFSRLERILGRRDVRMIISGLQRQGEIGQALRNVGLWTEASSIEFFENLNTALEYCENELLKAFYRQQQYTDSMASSQQRPQTAIEVPKVEQSGLSSGTGSVSASTGLMSHSPRRAYLVKAATTTLDSGLSSAPRRWATFKQPLPLILQAFQDLTNKNEDFWFQAVPYLERIDYPEGTILFSPGEQATSFFLLYSGLLRASYNLPQGSYHESIVAATTCGELPFFSSTLRTATVVAERDSTVWRLSSENWAKMQSEWPEGATEVLKVALKLTKERVEAVTSYVLTAAG